MITLKIKDTENLKKKTGKKNLLIACSLCPYWNYSQEEISKFAEEIPAEIKKVPTICNRPKIEIENLDEYDSILVFACGAGIQIVAEQLENKEIIPAVDTTGIGAKLKDKIEIYCKACGNCILDLTGGICPVARCPKSLLNGPCGGVQKGQCELGDRPCAWVLIYEKMKSTGKLEEFIETRIPVMR